MPEVIPNEKYCISLGPWGEVIYDEFNCKRPGYFNKK
jgi:hypothetical protein